MQIRLDGAGLPDKIFIQLTYNFIRLFIKLKICYSCLSYVGSIH